MLSQKHFPINLENNLAVTSMASLVKASTRDMRPAGPTTTEDTASPKVWKDEFNPVSTNQITTLDSYSTKINTLENQPKPTNPKTSKSNNNHINRTHLNIIPMGNIVSVQILAC